MTWWEDAPLASGNWWEAAPKSDRRKPQAMSEAATRDKASRTQTPEQMVEASGLKPRPTAGERFGQGFGDPYAAGSQIGSRVTPDTAFDVMRWLDEKIRNNLPGFENAPAYKGNLQDTQAVDQLIKQREADYQTARGPNAGFDWMRLGGNVAATAPLALAAPETLPGALAVGGTTGALQPVADQGNFWKQKGGQTLIGMGGGGVGYGVGKLASRLLAPKVTADVKALMGRGVAPTPGQILGGKAAVLEEKAASIPVLGGVIKGGQRRAIDQLNRAVYQEVLDPIGAKAPQGIGREAVAAVKDTISQGYDDVLTNPNVAFRPDVQFVSDLRAAANEAANLPTEEARQFTLYMQNKVGKVFGPDGTMDGRAFKTLESALRNKISKLAKSPDAYQNDLGETFDTLLTALRDGLARSNQNVTVNVGGKAVNAAERLQNLNSAWARFIRLQKASAAVTADEGFSPAVLDAAVKAADQAKNKGAFSTGRALMQDLSSAGRNVLGSKYPDSGTAGRLMTGGLAAALMSGGLAISPAMVASGGGVGLGMLPYTSLGQKLAAYLLAGSRPAAVKAAGSAVERAAPFMGTGLAALLAGRK